MYSRLVVDKVIDDFEARNRWRPTYHTIAETEEFEDYLNSVLDKGSNKNGMFIESWKPGREPTGKRKKWIKWWMTNEKFLCNPPEAPIWMADFTFKPIGDIKPGDQIIGWEKSVPQTKRNKLGRHRDRIVVSTVEHVMRRIAPIVKVTMESGNVIRCTADHNWSNGNTGGRAGSPWVQAKVGRTLRRLVDVYPNDPPDERLAGWLGGIYDGEGSRRTIFQSETANPKVFEEIPRVMRALGFETKSWENRTRSTSGWLIYGGWSIAAKFLAWCKPVKSKSLLNEIWSSHVRAKKDRIVSVEPDGEGEVISMQTSTGNYVCWGYMSKNCFADAEYFLTRYARIRAVDERIIRFEFRLGQRIFLDILAEFDDLQLAIQVFILKARQVGISTATALFFLHRILFRSNTHAIMASAQVGQSEKLGMIVETAESRLPFWLFPERASLKQKEPKWVNGSAMSIQAGSQTVGIAQGSTPTCIHLSELADYEHPEKTIEEGVFPAAHQTSSLFFVMEGTGSTASPWQKRKWDEYKKGGRFRPIFIPPACASDIYPTKDWLRGNPIPESWNPPLEVLRMKRRCELFVKSTDYLSKHLGSNWEMGLEYMWFWWLGWREAVNSHTEKTFLAMNAVTDLDAFQSKHDPVFSDEVIEIVTKDRQDYKSYAVTGKTIIMGRDNQPYTPENRNFPTGLIDYRSERIQLHHEAPDGNKYDWELIPLQPFDDESDMGAFNRLLVFEDPRKGARYSQGVDTAGGLGLPDEDRACTTVLRNEFGKDRDNQVCSFTSVDLNSAQMSRVAAAIAVFYTTDGIGNLTTSDPMGMRFIIEQITSAGDDCINQLQLMGFYNYHHFHWYDDRDTQQKADQGRKLGWRTTEQSRPILLDKFVNYVNMGWLRINDPILIRQMRTFIRKKVGEEKAKMIHDKGEHDDNIFATAMALLTAHDFEIEASRISQRWATIVKPQEYAEGWCEIGIEM